MAYTKLHRSIVNSTIWREPDHVRVVWITMLAIADQHGEIESSLPGLGDLARVPLDKLEHALARLSSPDKYSTTPDFDGRRIERTERGWSILNYRQHRERASAQDRKRADADRAKSYRERKRDERHAESDANVTRHGPSRKITEEEAEAEEEADSEAKKTNQPAAAANQLNRENERTREKAAAAPIRSSSRSGNRRTFGGKPQEILIELTQRVKPPPGCGGRWPNGHKDLDALRELLARGLSTLEIIEKSEVIARMLGEQGELHDKDGKWGRRMWRGEIWDRFVATSETFAAQERSDRADLDARLAADRETDRADEAKRKQEDAILEGFARDGE